MNKLKEGEWITVVIHKYCGYVEKVDETLVTISNNLPTAGCEHDSVIIKISDIISIDDNPGMEVRLK